MNDLHGSFSLVVQCTPLDPQNLIPHLKLKENQSSIGGLIFLSFFVRAQSPAVLVK